MAPTLTARSSSSPAAPAASAGCTPQELAKAGAKGGGVGHPGRRAVRFSDPGTGRGGVFRQGRRHQRGQRQRAGRRAQERYGRIDGLVNNAAIFADIRYAPFDEISVASGTR